MSTTSADILQAAEVGVDLLSAYSDIQAARQFGQSAAFSGRMERMQLRRRGEAQTAERQRRLEEALGMQRAVMAGSGIVGGRTRRLFELEARSAAQRGESTQRMTRLLQEQQSRMRQAHRRDRADTARLQAGLNLFSSLAGHYDTLQTRREAEAVAGGGD